MNARLARRVRHAEVFMLATLGSTWSARQIVNARLRPTEGRPSIGSNNRQGDPVANSHPIYKDCAPRAKLILPQLPTR
jgi:hypothetical protein